MDEIKFDTVTPSSYAYVYNEDKDMLLQHGGCVTRLSFDRLEYMPIATFLQKVVPSLKSISDNDMYVIRNSVDGSYTLILKDGVYRYVLNGIDEVPLDEHLCTLVDEFQKREKSVLRKYTPDLPWPIIADVETATQRTVTVKLQGVRVNYICSSAGLNDPVYLPPLWFSVVMTSAGMPTEARLAVATDTCLTFSDTTLQRWPFTNVWETGKVCLGSTTVQGAADTPTTAQMIQYTFDRIMNSDSQPDLIPSNTAYNNTVTELFNRLPDKLKSKFSNRLAACARSASLCLLIRSVAIHAEKDGWRRFPYRPAEFTASEFVGL